MDVEDRLVGGALFSSDEEEDTESALTCSDEDDEPDFACDRCECSITAGCGRWVLKQGAPLACNQYAFCLCTKCAHTDYLVDEMVDSDVSRSKVACAVCAAPFGADFKPLCGRITSRKDRQIAKINGAVCPACASAVPSPSRYAALSPPEKRSVVEKWLHGHLEAAKEKLSQAEFMQFIAEQPL